MGLGTEKMLLENRSRHGRERYEYIVDGIGAEMKNLEEKTRRRRGKGN